MERCGKKYTGKSRKGGKPAKSVCRRMKGHWGNHSTQLTPEELMQTLPSRKKKV